MAMFNFDPWQNRVLDHEGSATLRTGRQVGKSTVVSEKAKRFAETHSDVRVLVVAASLNQAGFLFEKIRGLFDKIDDDEVSELTRSFQKKKGRFPTMNEIRRIRMKASIYKEPPTKTKIMLKNGSIIHCLAVGRTGAYIRGLTIDLLIVDEAAFVPEPVWNSILPMVAVSRETRGFGWIILLSTPYGKGGYFYDSHHDQGFLQIHVSSEDCPRIDKKFLLKERQRMTKMEYAQEYLGEFVDEWNQFFPTPLIKKCASLGPWETDREYSPSASYYMGVDIARYGTDETAFVIAEMDHRKNIKIVKALTTQRMSLTDTVGRVLKIDEKFHFKRIFIDDAGIGGGVMDLLLEKIGRRVVGINNARRSVDKEDRKRAIMKEDLYSNALMMMEAGKLEMVYHLSLMKSLKSIEFEYTSEKNLKLYGKYSHLAEAFVRVCWSVRERGHKLFIESF